MSSSYPRALDPISFTDRLGLADPAIPALIDLHGNALIAAQKTLGTADDGTAYGAPGTFTRGLLGHTGLMTTDGPNARFPWPRAASSWYGTDNATPAAWTIPAGWVVSYGPPKGPIQIALPGDTTTRIAQTPLVGVGEFDAVLRYRIYGSGELGWLGFGFSASGNLTDFSGIVHKGGNWFTNYHDGASSSHFGTVQNDYSDQPWRWLWIRLIGGNLVIATSQDGWTWDTFGLLACTTIPTKLLLVSNFGALGANAGTLWVDYIAQGNTAPQGQ